MKKVLRVTENELKNIIKKVILENNDYYVNDTYNEIIKAVSGIGTNKEALLDAFDSMDKKIFALVYKKFSDGKTGYYSMEDMLDQEFDRLDYDDALKLSEILANKGIVYSFNYSFNKLKEKLFSENSKFPQKNEFNTWAKITYTGSANNECKRKRQQDLNNAIQYWRNWLKNPVTFKKFLKNYEGTLNETSAKRIFNRYFSTLNKIKPFFYDEKTGYAIFKDSDGNPVESDFSKSLDSYAFVNSTKKYIVFINCGLNDAGSYQTMIHEIQHILYDIYPINPEAQIGDVFVKPGSKKFTPEDFENTNNTKSKVKNTTENYSQTRTTIQNISKELKLDYNKSKSVYEFWKKDIDNFIKTDYDPYYVCRETEKMSNIQAIRNLFNVGPQDNITVDMIKPYITNEKKHTDVGWFLSCWALNGFKNLQQMINNVNQLAVNDYKKNQNTNPFINNQDDKTRTA